MTVGSIQAMAKRLAWLPLRVLLAAMLPVLLVGGVLLHTGLAEANAGLSPQAVALYRAQCPAIASAQLGQKLTPDQIKAYCSCTASAFQGLSGDDLSPVAAGGAQGALGSPKIMGLTRQCAAQTFGR